MVLQDKNLTQNCGHMTKFYLLKVNSFCPCKKKNSCILCFLPLKQNFYKYSLNFKFKANTLLSTTHDKIIRYRFDLWHQWWIHSQSASYNWGTHMYISTQKYNSAKHNCFCLTTQYSIISKFFCIIFWFLRWILYSEVICCFIYNLKSL